MVEGLTRWVYSRLESSLLPVEGTWVKKIFIYGFQFLLFCLFFLPACLLSFLSLLLGEKEDSSPLMAFAKHPRWTEPLRKPPAIAIGFATCDFQENGPEVHPETNWSAFLREKGVSFGRFAGFWSPPEVDRFLQRLQEFQVKHLRFSVSRDKIEPKEGHFYEKALKAYRERLRAMKKAGIHPLATLHHFTDPLWFAEKGGWEKEENIEGHVLYAEKACELLYQEGVRKICTFNELSVMLMQGYFFGEFPPARPRDLKRGVGAIKNMLKAHILIYERVKKRYPEMKIGITHNPVRFRPYHCWHFLAPLERILAHYLTEINHGAFIRFFKTGKFRLKVPFLVDASFTFSGGFPLDFFGLQYYTDPLLKASFKGIESATYEKGEKMSSYQYRAFPQGLASALEEARALKTPEGTPMPIEITEIGIDIGINHDHEDKERICYFDRLFQVMQLALSDGVPLQSAYFWTKRDNAEWHKGWDVRFGFDAYDPKTEKTEPRNAALWLTKLLSAK